MSGCPRRNRIASSVPRIRGITTSVTSTSIDFFCCSASSSASIPSFAAITSYPLALRNSQASSRTASSSSASSTVPTPRFICRNASFCSLTETASVVCGRNISKRVPWFTALSTQIYPPLCFTIPYTVERPSPVPFPSSLVVKNGSKILDFVCSSIPCPVSATTISTYFPAITGGCARAYFSSSTTFCVVTVNFPLLLIASRAFTAKLTNTCSICDGSALICASRSPGRNLYSISSPSSTGIILFTSAITAFKSSTCGCSTCMRLNASSCRVSAVARSAAFFTCITLCCTGLKLPSFSSSKSLCPLITVSKLLKSCATPPASLPTASIFCECLSCSLSI